MFVLSHFNFGFLRSHASHHSPPSIHPYQPYNNFQSNRIIIYNFLGEVGNFSNQNPLNILNNQNEGANWSQVHSTHAAFYIGRSFVSMLVWLFDNQISLFRQKNMPALDLNCARTTRVLLPK